MIIRFNGKKYLESQILNVIYEHSMETVWFKDAMAEIDAKQDRRNAIAKGIAMRDNELLGLSTEAYGMKRSQIEKEVIAELDGDE